MAFHWRNGIFFEKTDGHVRIFRRAPMTENPFVEDIAVIPDLEWCSIICAVGKGEDAEQFQKAKEFHGI